ncbi:MAG: aspartate/glutamate racemase family protein [bacterium]
MKHIGIVGGLSPESTVEYYRILTLLCRERGWDYNYPVIIIYSVNFQECMDLMQNGDVKGLVTKLGDAINALHHAGADFAIISANTPHMVFDEVVADSPIPLLSIVEETGKYAQRLDLKRVGLFGTKITMQGHFYPQTFSDKFGISVTVPEEEDQDYLHDRILQELVAGQTRAETRRRMADIARSMVQTEQIEGLILGCTELTLILSEKDLSIPVLDTTRIHVEAAFEYALAE